MLTVEKPFTTRTGRFAAGQKIRPEDLAGDAVPLEARQARGFVSGGPSPAAVPEPAPEAAPTRAKPGRAAR